MSEANHLQPWTDRHGPFRVVGTEVHRRDAVAKVTGTARYSVDTKLSGQLFAAIVRSPHPHARIRSVDVRDARAVPGVVDVLTAEDVEDVGGVRWYQEGVALLGEVVRYVGDEVAAVAAISPEAARDGEDNRTTAPKVQQRGDVAAGFADAAIIIDRTYRTPTAVHNAFEPHACVASWSGGELILYASTQGVNDVRRMIADALGLSQAKVRVVAEYVGGGFGAKQIPWKDVAIAALLARRTGRPVCCANDRRGENLAAGKRGATCQRVRLGATADGRLVAIDAELLGDSGAYRTGGESAALWGPYRSLYRCPAVRTTTTFVYTNTGPAVAFRAPGFVESIFALESARDELALRLGIDPIDLRRRNHTADDQESGQPLSSPQSLLIAYDRVAAAAGWNVRGRAGAERATPPSTEQEQERPASNRGARRDPAPGALRRGRGFAAHDWMAGRASPPGFAEVELYGDGSAEVRTSTQDIGTGTGTLLAQIAAEELGLDPDEVQVRLGDSAGGPPTPTSSGSATAPTMAPAVRAAAAEARARLLAAAAAQLQVDPAELQLSHGKLSTADGRSRSIAEVLDELSPQGVRGRGATLERPEGVTVRTFGAVIADVEVDTTTGAVRVRNVVVAPDCGRIVNPLLVRSQIIGGVAQGIGFALTESQLVDTELGTVVNASLEEYLIPTVADTCPVQHAALDVADLGANALGVKGIGELPLIAVPAAIANAVSDALGVRFTELPITRRRVLDALASDRSERRA